MFHKRYFTLLEVLLVLALLALFAGIIGWNVRGAMIRQRFLTEVSLVVDRLRLAQDMMLLLDVDMHVKFKAEKDQFRVYLDTDAELPKDWQETLTRSNLFLREIHSVSFLDQQNQPKEQGELDLKFFSNGSLMSYGELILSSHENYLEEYATVRSVCLYGAPHAIVSQPKDRKENFCFNPELQTVDDQLTVDTQNQVLAP